MRRRRSKNTSWRWTPIRSRRCCRTGWLTSTSRLGRIREAVTSAKEQIAANPNDIEAHKLLGKVYLRSLGDLQGQPSNEMLQLALTEYETLAKLQPNEIENHLLLGQLVWAESRLGEGGGAVQAGGADRSELGRERAEPGPALQRAGRFSTDDRCVEGGSGRRS